MSVRAPMNNQHIPAGTERVLPGQSLPRCPGFWGRYAVPREGYPLRGAPPEMHCGRGRNLAATPSPSAFDTPAQRYGTPGFEPLRLPVTILALIGRLRPQNQKRHPRGAREKTAGRRPAHSP